MIDIDNHGFAAPEKAFVGICTFRHRQSQRRSGNLIADVNIHRTIHAFHVQNIRGGYQNTLTVFFSVYPVPALFYAVYQRIYFFCSLTVADYDLILPLVYLPQCYLQSITFPPEYDGHPQAQLSYLFNAKNQPRTTYDALYPGQAVTQIQQNRTAANRLLAAVLLICSDISFDIVLGFLSPREVSQHTENRADHP